MVSFSQSREHTCVRLARTIYIRFIYGILAGKSPNIRRLYIVLANPTHVVGYVGMSESGMRVGGSVSNTSDVFQSKQCVSIQANGPTSRVGQNYIPTPKWCTDSVGALGFIIIRTVMHVYDKV